MSDVLVAFFIFNIAISLYTSCKLHGNRNIELLALFDDQKQLCEYDLFELPDAIKSAIDFPTLTKYLLISSAIV